MHQEEIICPYPGLRTFTEDESIFFKGRDEHIRKASSLLEHRKFLMITGASGEGKSSIVYAGIVPFARGGFIKSEYGNWAVVDFRPERAPLSNFSSCLEEAFTDLDEGVIRTNLGKGFSSLVELYKNSPLSIDTSTDEWNEADEKGRKVLKRRAANLLVIVDQFEEFFTNSENYVNGVPSDESALVVSTLLETARIAARDNLPIYIVFTMRSDFIGQCAAFRGLPEFIGYSQFFVPRLKRVDLKRVISEPAGLSGVVIKDRLVERLLYDLADGIDQLPILQHALNRIWNLAVEREEDLDLIHYAMAGGLDKNDLLPDDQASFVQWLKQLDRQLQQSYKNPELRNVLDAHANQLYYEAGGNKDITRQILETSFKCLTTVDEDRAVRNRMTLGEITEVLDQHGINAAEVDDTLRIFREEGNTFLKPYVDSESGDYTRLENDSVLDITHESLIRNWIKLRNWAYEENRDHEVLEELLTQMNHWLANEKSSSFLLSSGSLNYFEEWHNRVRPNKHWIWRYIKGSPGATMQQAEELLGSISEFIKKSINKNFVPRLFSRYGMLNVIAAIGTTMLLISSLLLVYTSRFKQNDYIIETVKRQGIELLHSNKVNSGEEAAFMVSMIRSDPEYFYNYLETVQDPFERLLQINIVLSEMVRRDVTIQTEHTEKLLRNGISILDSLVSVNYDAVDIEPLYRELLEFQNKAWVFKVHNKNPNYDSLFYDISKLLHKNQAKIFIVPEYYNATSFPGFYNIISINAQIESGIIGNHNLDSLLSFVSIFKNPSIKQYKIYPNDSLDDASMYLSLMALHGMNGEIDLVKQSFDSLFRDYADVVPAQFFDSFQAANTYHGILKGQGISGFESYMDHVVSRTKLPAHVLYGQMFKFLISSEVSVLRSGRSPESINNFPTIATMDEIQLFEFLGTYEKSMVSRPANTINNFELAQFYKFSGLLMDKYWTIHKKEPDREWLYQQFDKSIKIFNGIKDDLPRRASFEFKYYRDREIIRTARISLFQAYAYPDFLEENLGRHWARFYSGAFFQYLVDKELTNNFYRGDANFMLYLWVHTSNWTRSTDQFQYVYAFDNDLEAKVYLANEIENLRADSIEVERFSALAKLAAAYYQRWEGNEETAAQIIKSMDPAHFIAEYDARTTYELYASYLMDLIYKVNDTIPSEFFETNRNSFINGGKSILMFYGLNNLAANGLNKDYFSHLNNSFYLFNEYLKNTYRLYGATSIEYAAIPGLLKLGSGEMLQNVDRIIIEAEELNLSRNFKLAAARRKVKTLAEHGEYFEAYGSIGDASINARIILYKYMLDANFNNTASESERITWRKFDRGMRDANFVTENM